MIKESQRESLVMLTPAMTRSQKAADAEASTEEA